MRISFAIDTRLLGRLGVWSAFPLVRRGFAVGSQRVRLLMSRDSHSETTFRRIARILGGRSIEFLFIDGDHSRDRVRQDFDMYSALVAPGGLIAFHDISPNPAEWTQGVARFWQEFTAEHETKECVISGEPGFGIGLYRVPFQGRNFCLDKKRGICPTSRLHVPRLTESWNFARRYA
jgi:hypothetical protein